MNDKNESDSSTVKVRLEFYVGDEMEEIVEPFANECSAVLAAAGLASGRPKIRRYRAVRVDDGDVLCDVPAELLLARVGPALNELAGLPVVDSFRLARGNNLETLKDGQRDLRDRRDAEPKEEK